MDAIILAGGKGTRLAPYTAIFPKPLMPVGDVPILDIVLRQLKGYGFSKVIMAVGYLAELLETYFGNGSKYGIDIQYSRESKPLGTAGPLSLIENLTNPFLVMNGDILTTLNYAALIDYHKEKGAVATIAMHKRKVDVDFGVIELNTDSEITDYIEKPNLKYLVSMGIYIFDTKVLSYIKPDEKLDFPDLVKKLLKNKKKVIGYPSDDYWLDIGRHDDYQRAIDEFEENKKKFLPNESQKFKAIKSTGRS
ncbi:MAG: sugar phosphate nucleotidyltransferase [Elusimicrobiota bacterium]|nr:sugar phosphate nucleotidyltransferase [Elusimicrobiota bacterium]MDH5661762.1 sugar phosphate nucleotidyltransferase [Elusimicrobiota bacterium]